MLTKLLLAAVLAIAGCASTFATETDTKIQINFGIGGNVRETIRIYTRLWETGKQIEINTNLYSADAFIAYSLPGVCYTENAAFSPHAVSYLGLVPAYAKTVRLTNRLPNGLKEWFSKHHSRWDWIGFSTLEYEDLLTVWPEGECKGDVARMAPTN